MREEEAKQKKAGLSTGFAVWAGRARGGGGLPVLSTEFAAPPLVPPLRIFFSRSRFFSVRGFRNRIAASGHDAGQGAGDGTRHGRHASGDTADGRGKGGNRPASPARSVGLADRGRSLIRSCVALAPGRARRRRLLAGRGGLRGCARTSLCRGRFRAACTCSCFRARLPGGSGFRLGGAPGNAIVSGGLGGFLRSFRRRPAGFARRFRFGHREPLVGRASRARLRGNGEVGARVPRHPAIRVRTQ